MLQCLSGRIVWCGTGITLSLEPCRATSVRAYILYIRVCVCVCERERKEKKRERKKRQKEKTERQSEREKWSPDG